MSEASESLHFWRTSIAEVRSVVQAARVAGRIVASNERWTCFVPFEKEGATTLLIAAPGLILHWEFYADFYLRLSFLERPSHLGELSLGWHPDVYETIPDALTDRLRERGVVDSLSSLQGLAPRVRAGTLAPKSIRDTAAKLLGLAAYEWFSPHYVGTDSLEETHEQFPDAEDVEVPSDNA